VKKGILVRASDLSHTVIEFDDQSAYQVMKDSVGGWIDHCAIKEGGVDIWVNDTGLIDGLALNVWATFIASETFGQFYPLAGDVFVTGLPDDEGNSQGVPDEYFKDIIDSIMTASFALLVSRLHKDSE
jgi:hypothetical protein